jgi:hypothetical protein
MRVFSAYWFQQGKLRRRAEFTERKLALEAAGLVRMLPRVLIHTVFLSSGGSDLLVWVAPPPEWGYAGWPTLSESFMASTTLIYDSDCGFCRWLLAKVLAWDRRWI